MRMRIPTPLRLMLPFTVESFAQQLDGDDLCFGDPLTVGERTLITVSSTSIARVSFGGGGGGRGGGGGGWCSLLRAHARPVGFITLDQAGAELTWLSPPEPSRELPRLSAGLTPGAWRAAGRYLRRRRSPT